MAEIRPSYSILLLIDNTYSMDKTTIESFPYISFAKSVVKLIIERSRMCKMRLIIVYSDPFGKPKTIIPNLAQPPFQVPMEISHLEVSPSGFFDETIQEGFIQLNKTRYQKDPAEPYFVQKKNEFYSILLLIQISLIITTVLILISLLLLIQKDLFLTSLKLNSLIKIKLQVA